MSNDTSMKNTIPIVFALVLSVMSAGCDCLYSFRMSGYLTSDCGLVNPQGRDCYGDSCEGWQNIERGGGTYELYAGGNGSECKRPSHIELRAEGTDVITVVPDSDDVRLDIHLTCPN